MICRFLDRWYGAFNSRLWFFVRLKLDVQTIRSLPYVNSTSDKNRKSKTTHVQKGNNKYKTIQHIRSLLKLNSVVREFPYGE